MLEKRTEPPSVCRYREDSGSPLMRSASSRIWVRAKLEMSAPRDSDESEADSVADTVSAGGKIYRHISGSGSDDSGVPFPAHLESSLLGGLGGGFSMPSTVRKPMEDAFGRDFSHVRFHSDGESSRLSRSISARAFTYGSDIYFAQGQYNPHTSDGRHLIAHELTHVVQGGGKVSRAADHAEQRAIIQSYYVENWHWGQFYTYLATFHPQVVDALKLELDAGFFDTDWKDDRGPAFMNSVSSAIVTDIRRRNNNMNWDAAYSRAIREFNTCRNRLYPKIKPVFDCLIDLTRKGQERNASGNTRTIGEINAQRKNDLGSSSFSGEYFNNGESFLKDVYSFFRNEYPDALSYINHFALIFQKETIDEVSDMDEMRSAKFAEQLEPYIDSFIDRRSNAHIAASGRKGNAAKVNEMHYFLTGFVSEIAAHEKRYKSAGMLREVVESRLKNLYSTEFHVPEALVSSKAWTELFFRIMLEGGSIILGGPLIGRIMSAVVIKNPIARVLIEQAANTALDFVSGAGEEMIMEMSRGEELNARAILKEAGMVALAGRLFDGAMGGMAGMKRSFDDGMMKEADDVLSDVAGMNRRSSTLKPEEVPDEFIDILPDGTYKMVTKDKLPAVASGSPGPGKSVRPDEGDIIDLSPADYRIGGVSREAPSSAPALPPASASAPVPAPVPSRPPSADDYVWESRVVTAGVPSENKLFTRQDSVTFENRLSTADAAVPARSDLPAAPAGRADPESPLTASVTKEKLPDNNVSAPAHEKEVSQVSEHASAPSPEKNVSPVSESVSVSDSTPKPKVEADKPSGWQNAKQWYDKWSNMDEMSMDYLYKREKGFTVEEAEAFDGKMPSLWEYADLKKGETISFKENRGLFLQRKGAKFVLGGAAAYAGSRLGSDEEEASQEDYVSGGIGAVAAVFPPHIAAPIAFIGEYATQNWSMLYGGDANPYPNYPIISGVLTLAPLSTYWGPFFMGGTKQLVNSPGTDSSNQQPAVAGQPVPAPQPIPAPQPAPAPQSAPAPQPVPVPQPAPVPQQAPAPQPAPAAGPKLSFSEAVSFLEKSKNNTSAEDLTRVLASLESNYRSPHDPKVKKTGRMGERLLALAKDMEEKAKSTNDAELKQLYKECAAYLYYEESYYHTNTRTRQQALAKILYPELGQ